MAQKRVSLNIGEELNDWLDQESERTGFTKNALCHMAIERYKEQREGMKQMKALERLNELIEAMNTGDKNADAQKILELINNK